MFEELCKFEPRQAVKIVPTRNGEATRLRGYIFIWGTPDDRDCYGTWVDKLNPPELALDTLPFVMMYEHNENGSARKSRVGKVESIWFDDVGIGYEAVLDSTKPLFTQVVKEVRDGVLATSSGSSPHLASFDNEGRFVDWILAEVSLTKYPCEERMPIVEFVPDGDLIVMRSKAMLEDAEAQPHDALKATTQSACGCKKKQHTDEDASRKCSCKSVSVKPIIISNEKVTRMDPITLESLGVPADATSEDIVQALVEQFGREMVAEVYNSVFAVEGAPLDDVAQLVANAQALLPEADIEALTALVHFLFALIMEREDAVQALQSVLAGEETPDAEQAPVEAPSAPQAEAVLSRIRLRNRPKLAPIKGQAKASNHVSAELNELKREVRALKVARAGLTPALPKGKGDNQKSSGIMQITDLKYDHLSAFELAYGLEIMRSAAKKGEGSLPTEEYTNALVAKVVRLAEANDVIRSRFRHDGFSSVRADELTSVTNNSTWVGNFFSDQLWEKIRTRRVYQALLAAGLREVEVPQGSENFKILAEGADPLVYYAAETQDTTSANGYPSPTVPPSSPGLSLKTVDVSKLTVRTMPTGELEEDSMIPYLPFIVQSMEEAMMAAVESVLLFGDTETGATGNINSDDGALGATSKFLSMDGMAKLALVTNTDNSRDGSTLAAADYNSTVKLMGVNGLNPANVVHVVDTSTYYQTRELDEIETLDKFGQGATILTGNVTSIYGSPVMPSDQMGLAEADGKISTATPANNTKGRILSIAAPRWTVGWKRRITPEVQRWAGADATEIVMHARLGTAYADTDASAVSYNLTV